jgi:CheY-like chemotaxis protein
MVIYSDEMQRNFLEDIGEIEQIAERLKMKAVLIEISAMREAVKVGSVQEVSDGLVKFKAKMKIFSEHVSAARLPDVPDMPDLPDLPDSPDLPDEPKAPVVKPLLLAIHDKTSVLASITGVLDRGYKVISLMSGQRALDMLKNHDPAMILIGASLREGSGYELAQQIHKMHKKTPILFLTDVMAAVGDGHILVPIDRKLLLKKVEAALSGKSY